VITVPVAPPITPPNAFQKPFPKELTQSLIAKTGLIKLFQAIMHVRMTAKKERKTLFGDIIDFFKLVGLIKAKSYTSNCVNIISYCAYIKFIYLIFTTAISSKRMKF
jgi:hypothetical protein